MPFSIEIICHCRVEGHYCIVHMLAFCNRLIIVATRELPFPPSSHMALLIQKHAALSIKCMRHGQHTLIYPSHSFPLSPPLSCCILQSHLPLNLQNTHPPSFYFLSHPLSHLFIFCKLSYYVFFYRVGTQRNMSFHVLRSRS